MLPKKSKHLEHPYYYLKERDDVEVVITKKRSRFRRILPGMLITLGSVMIANVAWPLLSYQVFVAPKIRKTEFVNPLVAEQQYSVIQSSISLADPVTPQVLGVDLDYTDATNWFPAAEMNGVNTQHTQNYTIEIPSLNIEKAEVEIGGNDLDSSLIHYPGTANPGQLGSPVVFGHSVLRQFYNPSINNPNRYISIFSKIMTLENGEQIFVNYDGITYTYEVKDKLEVQPEDIFILEQRYNNRELKLITCVPEGTYLRRGVVIAQLVDFEDQVEGPVGLE